MFSDESKSPTPERAARLLARASGKPITETMIQTDAAAGMPLESDGTVNYLAYAAWLVRQEFARGK